MAPSLSDIPTGAEESGKTSPAGAPVDAVIEGVLETLAGLGSSELPSIEPLLRQIAEHASSLDPLAREVVRERTLAALSGKVQAPARLIELAFKSQPATGNNGRKDQGRPLHLADPEPWPEAVDGAVLLDELEALFRRYAVLPTGGAESLALWTAHGYAHDAAFVSPLLALTSPEKRCGKTTVLHILAATVKRPLPTSNITPAALFRTVERFSPTLLVDEADTFLADREELQGILNSGHTKRTAFVIRTVGDDHEPKLFSTWAPKVVALIGRLPSTLEDRSINIRMQRRTREERVERLRLGSLQEAEELQRKCARWAADSLEALRAEDTDVPEELHDRAADNWRPLLAIADLAGGRWPEVARRAAVAISGGESAEDSSPGAELLRDIFAVFEAKGAEANGADRFFSKSLLEKLCKDEGRPWGEWQNGKPLSPITMARMLKPLGVRPHKIRFGKLTGQGYLLADFEDAFARYLPPQSEHPEQLNGDGGLPPSAKQNKKRLVPTRKRAETPAKTAGVPGVPARKVVTPSLMDLVARGHEVTEP